MRQWATGRRPSTRGRRVATADAIGAYAEYCVAPADVVASVPDGVSTDVAAAAILKGMTAHLLIKSVLPVQQGDMVLAHAGAGGVGLILTQWATSLGARVISTASSPQKAELSRKAGAIDVLSYPDDAGEFGRQRSAHSPTARGSRPSTTASADRHSTPVLPVWPSGARWRCSVLPAGLFPPVDPQRLNAAGLVYLTRPSHPRSTRTRDEFTWRTKPTVRRDCHRHRESQRERSLSVEGRGSSPPRS